MSNRKPQHGMCQDARVLVLGTSAARPQMTDALAYDACYCFAADAADSWTRHSPEQICEIIDVYAESQSLEHWAWSMASDLTQRVVAAGVADAEHIRVIKRGLFMQPLWDVAVARARWHRVTSTLESDCVVHAVGMTAVETMVAGEISDGGGRVVLREAGAQQPASPYPRRIAGKVRRAVTAEYRSLQARWREESRWRAAMGVTSREGTCVSGDICAVYVGVPTQMNVLRTAVAELSRRGWAPLVIDMSLDGALASPIQFWDYYRPEQWRRTGVSRRRREVLKSVVNDWAREYEIAPYAPMTESWLSEAVFVRAPALIEAHATLQRALGSRLALTVNETADGGQIEAIPLAMRPEGVPTVNVQHGVITRTPRRAEFDFDAFCVFGEGYAQNLTATGTPARQCRVVGNPLLDEVDTGGSISSPDRATTRSRLQVSEQSVLLLFAAQHRNATLSDEILERSLATVLEGVSGLDGVRVIIKWHPVGEGNESGYHRALERYEGVPVIHARADNLYELIDASDAVATLSSTVGFEAAAMGRTTIVLQPDESIDRLPFVDEGTAWRARNPVEFAGCVRRLQAGERIAPERLARLDSRYHFTRDGQAGARIADVCEQLVREFDWNAAAR